jgi:NAD(P)H-hydrate epimerase
MREVDRLMVEEAGISLPQMMENAGRSLAALVVALRPGSPVTVLSGSGGNGGGGLVAARHLANRGTPVTVTLSASELSPVAGVQLDILQQMGIGVAAEPQAADVTIDALVGYGLDGDPRVRAAELIEWANDSASSIVALDVPSGVDADTGAARSPAIRAQATLTIALPKAGLAASDRVGDLYLADISVPQTVYSAVGIAVPSDLFTAGQVVRLV